MAESTPFIFTGPLLGPSEAYVVLGGRNETLLLDFVQCFLRSPKEIFQNENLFLFLHESHGMNEDY